ncbi:hypothetical protein MCAP1_000183 [Malassezia caprae]|uniref:Uncharacterized protein n=1 Tax=Malassezia caprae TaxID=1381934 RepID=A0AAF0E8C3_9BASI|nr:hypothetical protein MCAP1_000183 [Malassezia caprae]
MSRDVRPLLADDENDEDVFSLEEDAQYVLPQRRYLYAPISYEQAMMPQRPMWHPLYWYGLVREHWHIVDALRPPERLRMALERVGTALKMVWPHNRMHQTILIVFGLLALLSYANWAVGRALPHDPEDPALYWDFEGKLKHDVEKVQLAQRPDDGVVVQNATWSALYCSSTGKPLRFIDAVHCKAHTNFSLVAFPGPSSMTSTDHTYLFVNPVLSEAQEWYPREANLTQEQLARRPRKAPANVYVVTRPTPSAGDPHRDRILVDITATYDRQAAALIQHAKVAKLSHGIVSEGVLLLTHELPDYGLFASDQHESLRFDIVVSIPEGQPVAGLVMDVREGNIHVFTDHAFRRAHHLLREARGQVNSHGWPFLGSPQRIRVPPPSDTELAEMARLARVDHFFGRLTIYAQHGAVSLGGRMHVNSEMIVKTLRSLIETAAHLVAQYVYLWSYEGSVVLRNSTSVAAQKVAHFSSHQGSIGAEPEVAVASSHTDVSTIDGQIVANGVWHANLSMSMATHDGPIHAAVAVHKPALEEVPYEDFLRLGHGRRVETQFQSRRGAVNVQYVAHDAGVPLASTAHSIDGPVQVAHPASFEGRVVVQGHPATWLPGASRPGRHVVDEQRTTLLRSASVVLDEQARGPAPPLPPAMPPHLEPGKNPIHYGAESRAESERQAASVALV